MARSSEDAGDTFTMDMVARASNEPLAHVGSDNSSLTEGDLAILNRLQFLAERVELLERKLDNSLYNVKGSSDSDLLDNFAQDYSAINTFQVNVLTGPSCTQNDYSLDEGREDSSAVVTRETWENAQTEQTTSFLIIPVGNNKEHGVCTLQSEKQTLLAPEADLALPECITSETGEASMIVRPFAGTENSGNFNPTVILPRVEPATPPVSTESGTVYCESPNQTMFSTASIELANCLRSPSTRPHARQISTCVSEASALSPDNLNMSPNASVSSEGSTTGGCHSLTYGYTIGLATAKAQRDSNYPGQQPATDPTVPLDQHQHQHPEDVRMLESEESELVSRRSTVEFTPNSNRKFQYCVARTETGGRDAIAEAEERDLLSEVKQREYRLADESSNSGLQLSKHRHEAEDFIDSSNVREASHIEKPHWLLDANHNYVRVNSTDVAASPEREDQEPLCEVRGDPINLKEDDAKGITESSISTNGNDRYKRSWGNYDLSKCSQIEMQMRYTASQRTEVADGRVRAQSQAVNHSTNNERSEKFVNNHRTPAVYNSAHCVNSQGSVSDESNYSCNEASTTSGYSDAKDGTHGFRNTLPSQKNKKAESARANGGAKTLQKTRSATISPPPLTRAPVRKGLNSNSCASECAAHEQSFEKQLRQLIDPESIGPVPVTEKPLRHITAHSALAESKGLERPSFERGGKGQIIAADAQSNPLVDKDRSSGSYRSYATHPMTVRTDSSSDSPYSSLTSVSSALDLGQSAENSGLSFDSEYLSRNAISPRNERQDEPASDSPSVSYISTDFSSATAESDAFRSFQLSRLSLNQRTPVPLHYGDFFTRNNYDDSNYQLSSPTSSLDTSELSVIDSITECQCQYECECQTGIPTEEDFIEELKTISKYVLNARQKASAASNTNVRYYLDEEQGEMDILDAQFRERTRRAVPMLVKVILRLRKHFFGTVDSKTPAPAPQSPRLPPPRKSSEDGFTKRNKRISFSPSAVLLSAIGENSASEVKEVIEKEKLDVNQLSPSGRSLLHKASASGDLESIHTLIQHGARVNILDQDGFPPLHSALRKAHYKCAIFLMECGADLSSYTTGRVQEFLDITELAETYLGNHDHEHGPYYGTMLNTAL